MFTVLLLIPIISWNLRASGASMHFYRLVVVRWSLVGRHSAGRPFECAQWGPRGGGPRTNGSERAGQWVRSDAKGGCGLRVGGGRGGGPMRDHIQYAYLLVHAYHLEPRPSAGRRLKVPLGLGAHSWMAAPGAPGAPGSCGQTKRANMSIVTRSRATDIGVQKHLGRDTI